eukprot:gene14086-17218_t
MNLLPFFLAGLTAAFGLTAMAQSPNGSGASRLDEGFKKLDFNQDQKLDAGEFARFIERSRSLSGSNANEVFGKLDTNKDAALTLEEFRGVM